MPSIREIRRILRGTDVQIRAYTGPSGEPALNITTKRQHVMDGVTPGGIEQAPWNVAAPADRAVPVPTDLRAGATKTIYDYGLARGATDITAALAEIRKATDSPVVLIPEGVWTATSPATTQYFASNTLIRGAGRGKTVIKLVGASSSEPLFAWQNASGVGARDLTIDVNAVPAGRPFPQPLCSILYTSNVRGYTLENFEIIGMQGDRRVGQFALKTTHARVTRSRFFFNDAQRRDTGGILIDNSYFGSRNVGSISDRTMTITTFGGYGAPEGLYVGQSLQGKGVPLNCRIVRQISGATGREGTYEISHAASVPAGTTINGVANDDWVIRDTEFRRCIVANQATRFVSVDNYYNGWGSGSAIIFDTLGVGGKSVNDRYRDASFQDDGTYQPDVYLIWGDCCEVLGDFVQIINPDAQNLGNCLAGVVGDNCRITGGQVRKFAQASIHNATLTGSTFGNKLTVASVSVGAVIVRQILAGPGVPAGTFIQSDDGNGVFTLSQNVTAAATGQPFTTAAPISGGAVFLQQNSTLNGTATGTKITGLDIIGSGTAGERYGIVDQDNTVGLGSIISATVSGVSESPYRIYGKAAVVDPGAALTPAQLALVAPNKGTVLGVAGVGLTPAGVVSGTGTYSAIVFGDGTKYAIPVPPVLAWTVYTPTYTPAGGSGVTVTHNRASYEVVGKTLRMQVRFTLGLTAAPGYIDVTLPTGLTLKDGSAGAATNLANGQPGAAAGQPGANYIRVGGAAITAAANGGGVTFGFVGELN